MISTTWLCSCFLFVLLCMVVGSFCESPTPCNELLVGQYECNKPVIDEQTQEIKGCTIHRNATVKCFPLPSISCAGKTDESQQLYFLKTVPCRYTNGYSYVNAIFLSLFLGWLGVDRFYLGYPALGLLKLCTFGVWGIGALVDFMLIALQIILPSDGSEYVIDFYGPRLFQVLINNDTYYKPISD